MMSLWIFLIAVCPCIACAHEPEAVADEVKALEQLIAMTQKQLEEREALADKMHLFQEYKARFINGEQTPVHAARMVGTAREILTRVEEQHLGDLFSLEYLEELSFFASIAGKNTPKRPPFND